MVAISSKNSEEVRSLSARVIREGWNLKNGNVRERGGDDNEQKCGNKQKIQLRSTVV